MKLRAYDERFNKHDIPIIKFRRKYIGTIRSIGKWQRCLSTAFFLLYIP